MLMYNVDEKFTISYDSRIEEVVSMRKIRPQDRTTNFRNASDANNDQTVANSVFRQPHPTLIRPFDVNPRLFHQFLFIVVALAGVATTNAASGEALGLISCTGDCRACALCRAAASGSSSSA